MTRHRALSVLGGVATVALVATATQVTSSHAQTPPEEDLPRTPTQLVRIVRDGESLEPTLSATVRSGDVIQVISSVRGSRPQSGERPELKVLIPTRIDTSGRLRIGFESGTTRPGAILRSEEALELGPVIWSCMIPPEGICPVKADMAGGRYRLTARLPREGAVVFSVPAN